MELDELNPVLDKLTSGFEAFKAEHKAQLQTEIKHREDLERKINRQKLSDATATAETTPVETWVDTKSKQRVPVLSHKHRLADLEQNAPTGDNKAVPSMGRVLRGLILGGRADDHRELAEERKAMNIGSDAAGGFTVDGATAAQWIDLLRAKMVLNQAGCRTVPMSTKSLGILRVATDPTISWHGENASITPSDPTFGMIELNARTVVCVVKMSLELAQDSSNVDQVLQSTVTSAMACAIDSAGLVGVTTDAAAAPSGIMNLTGRNTVTSIGAPTSWDFLTDGIYELLVDNVPMENIGAFVAHPAVWKKLRKLKTGIASDNTPLTAPAEIAALPKLWTTAAPLTGGTTAKGIIANWSDLVFGVRQNISVRVLDQAYMGSNLQVAMLAYARVDFGAQREASFCTLEGITV